MKKTSLKPHQEYPYGPIKDLCEDLNPYIRIDRIKREVQEAVKSVEMLNIPKPSSEQFQLMENTAHFLGFNVVPCSDIPKNHFLVADSFELKRSTNRGIPLIEALPNLILENKAVLCNTGNDWADEKDVIRDLQDDVSDLIFDLNRVKEDWINEILEREGYKYITQLFKGSIIQKKLLNDAKIKIIRYGTRDYLYIGGELTSSMGI